MSLSHQADSTWVATVTESQVVGSYGAVLVTRAAQAEYGLTRMGDANQFIGLGRTFLLLDKGNNNLVTLVDAFQWESGDFYKPVNGRCAYNPATRQCPPRAHWLIEN